MTVLWMLAMLAAIDMEAPRGSAIEATIRGTTQPLEIVLLLRNDAEEWNEVDRENLPAGTRRIRFDGLASGVYQILVRGPQATEQLATKIAVGAADMRRTTITIAPFVLTGRVNLGGTNMGSGVIVLRHRELHWRAGIAVAADGTFRGPFWQRGAFSYSVSGPTLPTQYAGTAELEGTSPVRLDVTIPDGRITGVVRDAKSGSPVVGATVALQTNTADHEDHMKLTTGPDGRFDFAGIKYGRHTVRIRSPRHLEPEPIVFSLDDDVRLRELDVRLDPGRAVAIVVIGSEDDPVANAKVFAVVDSKLRSQTITDEDGQTSVPVPAGEATLFVVAAEGPFGMFRIPRDDEKRRLPVYLPRTSSSLLIRAQRTDGGTMPPFSLLMRFNGELVPPEVAEELEEVQGLQLTTGRDSEAHLRNIPSGSYEFWPYRSEAEAESIMAAGATFLAPIQVNVRAGDNKIAVKFAAR